MFPGETIASGASDTCDECGTKFENEILESPAGFYIGTRCNTSTCPDYQQPYSRESGYYETEALAEAALKAGGFERT